MEILSILLIGFSVLAAPVLFVTYAFFLNFPNKSWLTIAACGILLFALAFVQLGHLLFFQTGFAALENPYYYFFLCLIPVSFYFFSRGLITPYAPTGPHLFLHLLPVAVVLTLRHEIALPLLFLSGMSYSVWFVYEIYHLREQSKRFKAELFFYAVFSIVAVAVLILGFSIPYIDTAIFYWFYNSSIGILFVMVVSALLMFPNLLYEIAESANTKYAVSTLNEIDIQQSLDRLTALMEHEQIYQDENLHLAQLASVLELTTHQLSELINTQLGMSFPRFLRHQRVEAAKQLLTTQSKQSVLSIGMEVGFKSQSTFYTAFKEVAGVSPGQYRSKPGL